MSCDNAYVHYKGGGVTSQDKACYCSCVEFKQKPPLFPVRLCAAATARERTDFTLLLKEMYPRCRAANLLLTAATRAAKAEQHYELSKIHEYLDW